MSKKGKKAMSRNVKAFGIFMIVLAACKTNAVLRGAKVPAALKAAWEIGE